MTKRMLVHDVRLAGNAPRIAQNIYDVYATTGTSHIISWVGSYAMSQSGLDELIIMCHGYTVHTSNRLGQSRIAPTGAAGLQLGAQGLTLSNVGQTSIWKPHIRKIFVYACSAALRSTDNDPSFDGRRLCGELALHSGAYVFASDRTQYYHQRRTPWQRWSGTNQAGTIDFGAWEGTVYSYSPVTGIGTPSVSGEPA